jgi:hypothetical protein
MRIIDSAHGSQEGSPFDVINLYYDIDACQDCFYGAVAYEHMARSIGTALLRDVAIFSGDDSATLAGQARTYVISLVSSPARVDEMFVKLLMSMTSPLVQVTNDRGVLETEPLVYNGMIDADGGRHPTFDGSMIEYII